MAATAVLKEQREQALNALDVIIKAVEASEDGQFTDDQRTNYNDLKSKVEGFDGQIEDAEEREAMAKRIATAKSNKAPVIIKGRKDGKKELKERFNLNRAILAAADGKLTGVDKEMHEEGERQAIAAGVNSTGNLIIPSFQRDLLAETTNAGEENVATEVGDVIPFLHGRRVLTSMGAQVWGNLTSNISLPRNDAAGSGAWEGEGDAGVEVTPTFDTVTLSPKRFGGFINVSKQLLRQAVNSPGMVNFASGKLQDLIDDAVETTALLGGGAGEPSGLVDTLTVTSALVIDPTYADILSLETAVANANAEMGNIGYITNPFMRQSMKTIDVGTDTGHFLWDGEYMAGVTNMPGEGTVNGYRATTTTLLGAGGDPGTNYLIYGNYNDLVFGKWGGTDLLIDQYSLGKSAKIQVIANVWVDVALLQTSSFAYHSIIHP